MPWILLDGLPLSLTDEDLRRMCAPFGLVIQAHLVRMPDGTPIGFGRVEMASTEGAEAAREGLDGRAFAHHPITVRHLALDEEPPAGSTSY